MPAGRPTKYCAELQDKADEYLSKYINLGDTVPSRVGLCRFLSISKPTSYEWEREHPQFSDTLKDIEAEQERKCISGGLGGEFNATITKLMMANHGYHEKQQIDHQSSDGSMQPTTIMLAPLDNENGDDQSTS